MKEEQHDPKTGPVGMTSELLAEWGITRTMLVQITDDGVTRVEIDEDFNSSLYTDTGLCGGPCYLVKQLDITEGWLTVPQEVMVGEPQPGFEMDGIGDEDEMEDLFTRVGITVYMVNGAYDVAYFVASDEQLATLLARFEESGEPSASE